MAVPRVITVSSPVHAFVAYSFFIDAGEPAIIDTAVAASPEASIRPALAEAGADLGAVRWILLTHGHPDHAGGAAGVKDATGGVAKVVVHEGNADLVRSHAAHVRGHAGLMVAVRSSQPGRGCEGGQCQNRQTFFMVLVSGVVASVTATIEWHRGSATDAPTEYLPCR